MLPEGLWKSWEPRVILPTFKDTENIIDFSVQESLNKPGNGILYTLAYPLYNFIKKRNTLRTVVKHYQNIILRGKIKFRCIVLTRTGQYIAQWPIPGKYGAGEYYRANINEISKKYDIEIGDNLIVVVASRGRNDTWMSSPGSITIKYVSSNHIAGLRTGLFSRQLNEGGKGHFGFTGINPKVMFNNDIEPSVLLINHSSDPSYSRIVTPSIRLYRSPDEYIEREFGEIKPLGAVEVKISKLFPEVNEYLQPTQQGGGTIAKAEGSTLASYHIYRDKSGEVVAIDHSRPSHTNIIGR